MQKFDPCWCEFPQNPIWYVTTITLLTGLTFYLRFLWWLVGGIALVWGIWLVWQLFRGDETDAYGNKAYLRDYLAQSLIYKARIDQALKATSDKRNRTHRQQLAIQINIWTEAIRDLIQRIANLRQDNLIYRDIIAVPKAVEDLTAQLAGEPDVTIRTQLERALLNRRNQLASLEQLQNTIKHAGIQVENTLSLLGTIYSQILTDQSAGHVANYSRLFARIDEEVYRLQDQLEALWEVKPMR